MIPFRTDRRLKHSPRVNYGLIALNVIVFFATRGQIAEMNHYEGTLAPEGAFPVFSYFLLPTRPEWWQFVTYQFLHNDWQHILFNMLFLYVFGNSLNDRLGNLGYLFFYLGGGVVAGLGHTLTSDNPVLGASGAVSAVTGAFLALFPLSRVSILWVFIIIAVTEWPSMYFILLAFVKDLYFQFSDSGGQVAYLAHICGNAYGFAVGMLLLATRILPRDGFDMLSLLDRWNRRRQFRAVTTGAGGLWRADAPNVMSRKPFTEAEETILRLRGEVQAAFREHRTGPALDAMEALVAADPNQALPLQTQLDLAALAMREGRHRLAAGAYEAFLRVYPKDSNANEVKLVLGLLYTRYFHEPDRARPWLEQAKDQHTDESRRAFARGLLEEPHNP